MLKPVLNVENAKMEFSSVYLKCPSLLKNAELRIYGVSINSSSGINLHGIHFDLPDFKLGNGIGFRDVKETVFSFLQVERSVFQMRAKSVRNYLSQTGVLIIQLD